MKPPRAAPAGAGDPQAYSRCTCPPGSGGAARAWRLKRGLGGSAAWARIKAERKAASLKMKMEEAIRLVVNHLADEELPRDVANAVAELRKSLDRRQATREAGENLMRTGWR
jgi:hypothetical protein